MYTYVLSTAGKYRAGFQLKSFGGCCGSTVLMGASWWPSNNCNPAQTIVSVLAKLNHNRSALALDYNNGVCCHHFSS